MIWGGINTGGTENPGGGGTRLGGYNNCGLYPGGGKAVFGNDTENIKIYMYTGTLYIYMNCNTDITKIKERQAACTYNWLTVFFNYMKKKIMEEWVHKKQEEKWSSPKSKSTFLVWSLTLKWFDSGKLKLSSGNPIWDWHTDMRKTQCPRCYCSKDKNQQILRKTFLYGLDININFFLLSYNF